MDNTIINIINGYIFGKVTKLISLAYVSTLLLIIQKRIFLIIASSMGKRKRSYK